MTYKSTAGVLGVMTSLLHYDLAVNEHETGTAFLHAGARLRTSTFPDSAVAGASSSRTPFLVTYELSTLDCRTIVVLDPDKMSAYFFTS